MVKRIMRDEEGKKSISLYGRFTPYKETVDTAYLYASERPTVFRVVASPLRSVYKAAGRITLEGIKWFRQSLTT
jgi:hypothetical protein